MSILNIIFVAALIGAATGALIAKRRGGNRLDMAQYAGSFAILFALIGLFVSIFLLRTMA